MGSSFLLTRNSTNLLIGLLYLFPVPSLQEADIISTALFDNLGVTVNQTNVPQYQFFDTLDKSALAICGWRNNVRLEFSNIETDISILNRVGYTRPGLAKMVTLEFLLVYHA